MIVTRTPFRISFAGGGSDMPLFYKKHCGHIISTTIDKYVYLSLNPSFDHDTTLLRYSTVEKVTDIELIKHPIFKECLKMFKVRGVEISSTADIPSGTGLGSSSSFTVGLVNLLNRYCGRHSEKKFLAETAVDLELNILKNPIGKQDQYAAAYGGLKYYRFNKDGSVDTEPIGLSQERISVLQKRLMMFYLGGTRSASDILKEQTSNMEKGDSEINHIRIGTLTQELKDNFETGDIDSLGSILDEGWKLKRTLATGISNETIDSIYDRAIDNGATGGKLLGAGGNGFMLFYVPEKEQQRLISALPELRPFDFGFDTSGSSVVYNDMR